MKSFALASGSSGNSFYIESKEGTKLLVDLGMTYKKSREILKENNIDINEIDAVLITHEHADHIIGLESFNKNIKCPIYLTKGTFETLDIEINEKIRFISNKENFEIKDIKIFTIASPHDAADAVSYIFDDGVKLGVFTDLGEINLQTREILKVLDHIYIETNYCENKIKENSELNSYYVNRLVSNKGHLGLDQTIEALSHSLKDSQKIMLSHISETTNTYENSYSRIKTLIDSLGISVELLVSFQGEASEWME